MNISERILDLLLYFRTSFNYSRVIYIIDLEIDTPPFALFQPSLMLFSVLYLRVVRHVS